VLDERFAAGGISDVEHQAQRARAKQRLHQLTSPEGVSESGIGSLS
jgi:hypothetical protein